VRLRRSDLEAILCLVRDAEELTTGEAPFPDETLARFAEVVACDDIGMFEVDRVRRRDYPLDGEQDDRWWEIAHQQPVCRYVEETGDFRALKSPISSRAPSSTRSSSTTSTSARSTSSI